MRPDSPLAAVSGPPPRGWPGWRSFSLPRLAPRRPLLSVSGRPRSRGLAASHAALLSDGKVMVWSDHGYVPRVWDPATNGMTTLSQVASNIIGSGHALLDDGDVAIVGGRLTNGTGIQDAHWYDRAANGWFNLQYMTQPRSEPTAILLGDARILALSGQRVPGQPTDIPECNVPVAPWTSLGLALLGLPRTPWAFQLSDGRVLVAGPDRAARKLDLAGDGSWTAVDNMLSGSRDAGSAVLVPGATDRVWSSADATRDVVVRVLDVPVSGVRCRPGR
jgi:hypothetical protein